MCESDPNPVRIRSDLIGFGSQFMCSDRIGFDFLYVGPDRILFKFFSDFV